MYVENTATSLMSSNITIYTVLLTIGLAILLASGISCYKTSITKDKIVIISVAILLLCLLTGTGMYIDSQEIIAQTPEIATAHPPPYETAALCIIGMSIGGTLAISLAGVFYFIDSSKN